ncbi:DUF3168 domain-containing protein [Brevundimonas sp.]|uniref:DUF3168 domain-containing protein n=1 Tax=Brevundimonas sp. TaxID=1871086 RepID=UPI0035B00E19
MAHPALPLQKAIYKALSEDEAITEVVTDRIYDHLPEDAQFPYICLADDAYSRDRWFHECYVTVQAFTEGEGMVDVKALASLVDECLTRQLIVEDFDTVEYAGESIEFYRDPKAGNQMAELELRYLLEPQLVWYDE